MPLAGAGLAVDGRNPHPPHQGGHVPPTDPLALLPEEIAQHPGARKGILQMQLVNPAHQAQHGRRHRGRPVVGRGARYAEQLALPDDG
jgi:hypothetical protein